MRIKKGSSLDQALLGVIFFGLVVFVALLVHGRSSAEVSLGFRLPASGLVKADLDPQLYQDTIDNPIADPGLVLTENGATGDYQWSNLPDVAAGSGTVYFLIWGYDGLTYIYNWPSTTRTPQSVINRLSESIVQNPIELYAGSTLPAASIQVRGLSSDPTGATATFSLWTTAGTSVISGASASVTDIDELVDGTWEATVVHPWTTVETSALSGLYYGRFTITLPGGDVLVRPPAPSKLNVRVYP